MQPSTTKETLKRSTHSSHCAPTLPIQPKTHRDGLGVRAVGEQLLSRGVDVRHNARAVAADFPQKHALQAAHGRMR